MAVIVVEQGNNTVQNSLPHPRSYCQIASGLVHLLSLSQIHAQLKWGNAVLSLSMNTIWVSDQVGHKPGCTQTGLYSHRRWLEAGNFGFTCRK